MLSAVDATARVVLQGRAVGELAFRAGGCTFRYTDDLRDPRHHVLGQVFEESPRQRFRESVGLPAWFSNLLPEKGSGLRRYYAGRFGERELDDARLLLLLGGDLPGAATVEPVDVPATGVLVETAAAGIDRTGVHLSALAGAQRKMSVLRDGERLTLPAAGESGDWIVKLPGPESLFDTRLEPGDTVYVIKRFDRPDDGSRLHMEDLAQVTGRIPMHRGRGTYDGIGRLIHELTGPDGFADYLRRLVAMLLMGNDDATSRTGRSGIPMGGPRSCHRHTTWSAPRSIATSLQDWC